MKWIKFNNQKKLQALGVTWIYSISIWSSRNWSQDGGFWYSNILAVVRVKSPEGRITKSDIRNDNVTWSHELHQRTPCVIKEFSPKFYPPTLTLSIYGTIMTYFAEESSEYYYTAEEKHNNANIHFSNRRVMIFSYIWHILIRIIASDPHFNA